MKTGRKSHTLISHSIGVFKGFSSNMSALFIFLSNVSTYHGIQKQITSSLTDFFQLNDYRFILFNRFTSGIVFESPLPLLNLASGGEKEECDQEKAPAKLLRAAKVAGET